jgi:DNA polymerase/3'-5' exonuclease PolX
LIFIQEVLFVKTYEKVVDGFRFLPPTLHALLKKEIPESLRDMLRIPGLGPKKIKALHEQDRKSVV